MPAVSSDACATHGGQLGEETRDVSRTTFAKGGGSVSTFGQYPGYKTAYTQGTQLHASYTSTPDTTTFRHNSSRCTVVSTASY